MPQGVSLLELFGTSQLTITRILNSKFKCNEQVIREAVTLQNQ